MPDKRVVLELAIQVVQQKIELLREIYADSLEALESESKSSAGDKHETGRAMAQLEQEKIAGQLQAQSQLLQELSRIDASQKHTKIQFGSLIELSTGWFFMSVGIGKIQVKNTEVYCINAISPIGKLLLHKVTGEAIQINGHSVSISSII